MSCLALAAFGKILSYHSTLASLRLKADGVFHCVKAIRRIESP